MFVCIGILMLGFMKLYDVEGMIIMYVCMYRYTRAGLYEVI